MRLLLSSFWILLVLAVPPSSRAAEVNLIGLFGSKATLMLDSGKPRTLAVGETSPDNIRLISIAADSAVIEFGGRRETIRMGNQRIAAARSDGGAGRALLTGDSRGHFMTTAVVNGVSMPFLLDTGATAVTIGSDDAKRANIKYSPTNRSMMQTANGLVIAYNVKFDTVRVGDIMLNNVDGIVMENQQLGIVGLLGMSFLNRTEMQRSGDSMTLTRRY